MYEDYALLIKSALKTGSWIFKQYYLFCLSYIYLFFSFIYFNKQYVEKLKGEHATL